ncbi:ABC transporter ATP-binding protein [Nonomuraea sp. NPDC050643]|uniref:ABC transporter ATP-binding protein n=1 Tax=Nonomuraea sp. NPDC050643 TaxID=3155660 RepID=UPI003410200C
MTALLDVRDLVAGYDGGRVLNEVGLHVDAGEAVTLLGRNGVGKTTLVHTIMGFVRPDRGTIRLDGRDVAREPASAVARAGVAIVPQGRRVFAPLTVEEHLQIADRHRGRGEWTRERVYETMPRLAERRDHLAAQLSGGEQQLLAIGRALLGNPRLLLLDEPSEGLAPVIVDRIRDLLLSLISGGIAVLLVEQNLRLALTLASRVLVMSKGTIVHESSVADFRSDAARARTLLGVT